MGEVFVGGFLAALGAYWFAAGVRYLQGRGDQWVSRGWGPNVVLIGAGPLFIFLGLILLWRPVMPSIIPDILGILCALSLLLMFALWTSAHVTGWPRYGQWPHLLTRRRSPKPPDHARRATLSADKELGKIDASINDLHGHRRVVLLGDLAHRRAKAIEAVRAAAQEVAAIEAHLSEYSDVPTSPHDLREHVADLTRRAGLVWR